MNWTLLLADLTELRDILIIIGVALWLIDYIIRNITLGLWPANKCNTKPAWEYYKEILEKSEAAPAPEPQKTIIQDLVVQGLSQNSPPLFWCKHLQAAHTEAHKAAPDWWKVIEELTHTM